MAKKQRLWETQVDKYKPVKLSFSLTKEETQRFFMSDTKLSEIEEKLMMFIFNQFNSTFILSIDYLADFIGCDRSMINKCIQRFEELKLIRKIGKHSRKNHEAAQFETSPYFNLCRKIILKHKKQDKSPDIDELDSETLAKLGF